MALSGTRATRLWVTGVFVGIAIPVFKVSASEGLDGQISILEERLLELQNDMSEMRNRLEKLEHKTQKIQAASPPTGASSSPSSALAENPKAPEAVSLEDTQEAVDDYNQALDLLQGKKYSAALAAFRNFEKDHPKSRLREMARYWTGVTHFVQNVYTDALETFQDLLRDYPNCSKKADALKKIALCREALASPSSTLGENHSEESLV